MPQRNEILMMWIFMDAASSDYFLQKLIKGIFSA